MFSNDYKITRNQIIFKLSRNLERLEQEANDLRPVRPLDSEKFAAVANAYANTAKTLLDLMREADLNDYDNWSENDDDEF